VKHRRVEKRQRRAQRRRIKLARQRIADRKRRVQQRIKHKAEDRDEPMFPGRNIQFEIADRTRAVCYGGIGLMHSLVRECGLAEAIDRNVQLLQFHFPYHESDHVLNIPESGRWKERRRAEKRKLLRMEFRTFVNTPIRVPCHIVKTGRRIVYRVLSWNESQPVFWRLAEVLRC